METYQGSWRLMGLLETHCEDLERFTILITDLQKTLEAISGGSHLHYG